jgi:hypothetical protein
MWIRRREDLFIRSVVGHSLDVRSLLQGGVGTIETSRWVLMSPWSDSMCDADPHMLEVLQSIPCESSIGWRRGLAPAADLALDRLLAADLVVRSENPEAHEPIDPAAFIHQAAYLTFGS